MEEGTSFNSAVDALFAAHEREINDIRNLFAKEKLDWEQKKNELEEQINILKKEKHELKLMQKKSQILLDNYRSKLREGNQNIESISKNKGKIEIENQRPQKRARDSLDQPDDTNNNDSRMENGTHGAKHINSPKTPTAHKKINEDRMGIENKRDINNERRKQILSPKTPPHAEVIDLVGGDEEDGASDHEDKENNDSLKLTTRSKPNDAHRKEDKVKINTDTSSGKSAAPRKDKYKEVVRNKEERAALPGHECEHCSKFFDAITVADGRGSVDRKKLVQLCSRHRYADAPPSTPPGYWQLSFPPTQQ